MFQVSLVATSPKFSNRVMRLLASGWQVAPNLEIKSAQFFTVVSGSDRALSALSTNPLQPPNLVMTNPYPSNQSVDHWVITTAPGAPVRDAAPAFVAPDLGTYGNLGYNNLKGPGVFQLNLALSRNFTIREKSYIQLRAEAFNLPNHLNPFTPSVTGGPISGTNLGGLVYLNAPDFGKINYDISGTGGLTAGDYRVVQLAMKFIF